MGVAAWTGYVGSGAVGDGPARCCDDRATSARRIGHEDVALDVDQLVLDVPDGVVDALVVDRRAELGDEEVDERLDPERAELLVELPEVEALQLGGQRSPAL